MRGGRRRVSKALDNGRETVIKSSTTFFCFAFFNVWKRNCQEDHSGSRVKSRILPSEKSNNRTGRGVIQQPDMCKGNSVPVGESRCCRGVNKSSNNFEKKGQIIQKFVHGHSHGWVRAQKRTAPVNGRALACCGIPVTVVKQVSKSHSLFL